MFPTAEIASGFLPAGLVIAGDADGTTLEHNLALFRLLGGGGMGDMGEPLPASRLAILPATSHTAEHPHAVFHRPIVLRGVLR